MDVTAGSAAPPPAGSPSEHSLLPAAEALSAWELRAAVVRLCSSSLNGKTHQGIHPGFQKTVKRAF